MLPILRQEADSLPNCGHFPSTGPLGNNQGLRFYFSNQAPRHTDSKQARSMLPTPGRHLRTQVCLPRLPLYGQEPDPGHRHSSLQSEVSWALVELSKQQNFLLGVWVDGDRLSSWETRVLLHSTSEKALYAELHGTVFKESGPGARRPDFKSQLCHLLVV